MKFSFEAFGPINFAESAVRAAEKFCWRGYRILTCCPVCLETRLSEEEACLLKEAFVSPQNYQRLESFADTHDIGLLILMPSNHKTAQLLNFRLILAPLCRTHSEIDGDEIESRILLISRCGNIVKR